jgi:hypothetical protein
VDEERDRPDDADDTDEDHEFQYGVDELGEREDV